MLGKQKEKKGRYKFLQIILDKRLDRLETGTFHKLQDRLLVNKSDKTLTKLIGIILKKLIDKMSDKLREIMSDRLKETIQEMIMLDPISDNLLGRYQFKTMLNKLEFQQM